MFKYISIAYRQLFSQHSFSFIYVTSLLGVLGISIGIASLIIISCLSDGFSNVVNSKLSSIDGHVRVNNYYQDMMSMDESTKILDILNSNSQIQSSHLYTENHAMIKNGGNSEGVIVYGCYDSALVNIFNLNHFIDLGSIDDFDSNSAILGSELANNLNLSIGDEFYLFNVDDIIRKNKINALPLKLNGIIDTEFLEYDRLLVFISLKTSQKLFSDKDSITGIISRTYNPMSVNDLDFAALDEYPVHITTWKDRHSGIISWLNIYDIPIKLIMFLIVLVSILNIIITIWMISFERKSEFAILKAIGFRVDEIKTIILLQSLVLTTLGCIIGCIIAFISLFAQHKYHFISLSSDIYFMNYLPVFFNQTYFLLYPLIALLISYVISLIPASKIANYSPARVLMYE